MRARFRDALQSAARSGSPRTLLLTMSLAVMVVLAAGLGGAIHFSGARWVPHFKGSPPKPSTHKLPSVTVTTATKRLRLAPGGSLPLWPFLVGIGVVLLAVIAWVAWRWWMGRPERSGGAVGVVAMEANRPPQVEPEPEPEPDAPALLTGIELALQVLDEERDPADAIVRAWLGMQETAEESGILRQPAETPTEFTSRIMNRAFADDQAIRTLLRLYLRTRFSDHSVTAQDVDAARAALQGLVQTWHASDVVTPGGAR